MTTKEAIEILASAPQWDRKSNGAISMAIKALEAQEPLTDDEQRIFLAAISREEKVCKKMDEDYKFCKDENCIELLPVCRSIERKVKKALWS